jgi:hypothetical protein
VHTHSPRDKTQQKKVQPSSPCGVALLRHVATPQLTKILIRFYFIEWRRHFLPHATRSDFRFSHQLPPAPAAKSLAQSVQLFGRSTPTAVFSKNKASKSAPDTLLFFSTVSFLFFSLYKVCPFQPQTQ